MNVLRRLKSVRIALLRVRRHQAFINQAELLKPGKGPSTVATFRIADFTGCFVQVAVNRQIQFLGQH
eukprot:gene2153-3060_t